MNVDKLSDALYSDELDIKKFENLLSHNNQGYKFFWLEAIMELISQNRSVFTFEEVVNEMIVGAWKMVIHHHLRLGLSANGNAENFLEHAVKLLNTHIKNQLHGKNPSSERLLYFIKEYDSVLLDDKNHLTDYVPYRLIKPFMDKKGNDFIDKKNYGRFIAYLNEYIKMNNNFFYNIIEAQNPLQRQIIINDKWRAFIITHYAVILGWIRFNKAKFIQERNPGVPSIMEKVDPESENKRKSLKNARELWLAAYDTKEIMLYEIYTKQMITPEFDLDHFVPRSFVAHDELWNLTPMSKKLNSSKNNRIPKREFIQDFVEYNYSLYTAVFNSRSSAYLMPFFENCRSLHINAPWASEKLYVPGNSEEKFINLLEENLTLVYDTASLLEYELWDMEKESIE